jgi:hypothetical protein
MILDDHTAPKEFALLNLKAVEDSQLNMQTNNSATTRLITRAL